MLARLLAVAFAVALAIPPTSASRAAAQSDSAEAARDRWQRVPELLQAMDVREGSVVADVGAGAGFLTVRLAAAVGGSGRVYAVDIVPDVLKRLRERLSKERLNNVVVVEGTEADPRLPAAALDAIVMVNAYHEVDDAPTVLQAFRVALKQGARLVLCEPGPKSPGASRAAQVKSHVLSPQLIEQELVAAGFRIVGRDDAFTANPSGGVNAPYSLVVATTP